MLWASARKAMSGSGRPKAFQCCCGCGCWCEFGWMTVAASDVGMAEIWVRLASAAAIDSTCTAAGSCSPRCTLVDRRQSLELLCSMCWVPSVKLKHSCVSFDIPDIIFIDVIGVHCKLAVLPTTASCIWHAPSGVREAGRYPGQSRL